MSKNAKLAGVWFCGNEASDYAKENGYLDYATLAKAFDAVDANNIVQKTDGVIGFWEQENGVDNSEEKEIENLKDQISDLEDKLYEIEDEYSEEYLSIEGKINDLQEKIDELENETDTEIFQYYIISSSGAEILEQYTDEIVLYNEELDMYVWGVTHWGTSWDYVLTDIKLNCGYDNLQKGDENNE